MAHRHTISAFGAVAALMALSACGREGITLEVANTLDEMREGEIVEMPVAAIQSALPSSFRMLDRHGDEVPYQITYDSLLIFPATVEPLSVAEYRIVAGEPAAVDTVVVGKLYPERLDDIAWENERSGYRIYGPAYQASGGKVFGYDIHTKKVEYPAVDERYAREIDETNWERLRMLREAGRTAEADSLQRWISYHVDTGTGMDVYTVGPTLGAGVSAFMRPDSTLIYPKCYTDCEILDNGPLRFTVKLRFGAEAVGADTAVVEHRLLSLDSGAPLNRTVLRYEGMSETTPIVSGIVVHRQNTSGTASDPALNIIAYADSTDNPDNDNGVIYIGVMTPQGSLETAPHVANIPLKIQAADAVGHTALISRYVPDSEYVYYWGSDWSKHGITSMSDWMTRLQSFARRVGSPLTVTIKK